MTLFRGKIGGTIAFLGIAALVVGGLGWVTREALSMEEERRIAANAREQEKIQKEHDDRWHEKLQQASADRSWKMGSALMLLDSRITPALAREDSRPYPHYDALHSPFPAMTADGLSCAPGQFLIPSPLMTAQLPEWMLLHFQVDPIRGWSSPQVIPADLQKMLRKQPIELALNNVDEAHQKLLNELKAAYPVGAFLAMLPKKGISLESQNVEMQQAQVDFNINPGNSLNNTVTQNSYAPSSSAPSQTLLTTQNAQNGNEAPDSGKRFQVINRGKFEGLWAFVNEGRNYSSMQGAQTLKSLNAKQAEIGALEKQLQAGSQEAKKQALQGKIDSLKKESDELRRKATQPEEIELTPMKPIWLPNPEQPKHLLLLRSARVGVLHSYQGILLDWNLLQSILKSEVDYLFPEARFIPIAKNNPDRRDREMFALPIELDAGPASEPEIEPMQTPEIQSHSWTPLRFGLALAWAAALVALIAVGLGGWTLLDLSERRIRFVSAVTHELRTPLTTLRLYLDLLNSGLVSEETQRDEYIKTLSGEADRLHRLIVNVLDFARLEKTRPTIEKRPVPVSDLLEQLRQTWNERCAASGKDLQTANALPVETVINTDRNLVEQILGNLIDNARKYSQDAADPHIWLRALREGGKIVIEVEDCGPGVTKRERGSIFRAFRRGHDADVKAGGVGLGLALATRWAAFVGGQLSVQSGQGGVGACFRLELPG